MSEHEHYMKLAIALARQAEGFTSPNPPVGCVIVKDGKVVGEGFTQKAGSDHAEVVAIKKAANESQGATMYITLEPCKHFGRTPPCTNAIINAKLSTVVFATDDPNENAGGGARLLEAQGIEVIRGVLDDECRYQNRFYLHFQKHGKPFVIGKFASSLDGRTATRTGHSKWITGETARQRGHSLRQAVDAILVGSQTVIDDNPSLTTRSVTKGADNREQSHPLRVILDGSARVPLDCNLYSGRLPGQTLIVTSKLMSVQQEETLTNRGLEVVRLATAPNSHFIDLNSVIDELGRKSILSLMIEGGQTVLGSFLDAKLINEIWAFLAPKLIGGKTAPAAIGGLGIDVLEDAPEMTAVRSESLGQDLLITGSLAYPENS